MLISFCLLISYDASFPKDTAGSKTASEVGNVLSHILDPWSRMLSRFIQCSVKCGTSLFILLAFYSAGGHTHTNFSNT